MAYRARAAPATPRMRPLQQGRGIEPAQDVQIPVPRRQPAFRTRRMVLPRSCLEAEGLLESAQATASPLDPEHAAVVEQPVVDGGGERHVAGAALGVRRRGGTRGASTSSRSGGPELPRFSERFERFRAGLRIAGAGAGQSHGAPPRARANTPTCTPRESLATNAHRRARSDATSRHIG